MTDIVIASAARTPVGAFNGGLASLPAHKLGEVAIVEALRRAEVEPKEVSEVIMGQILPAGEGQNPARQAAVAAGIPFETTAYGVNQLCGSGLRTVALGYQAIRNGDSDIVVAGGQESMSQAPHCIHLRNGVKMGDARDGRHDDQGRAVGRLQRLPHGQHRRERRAALADHPRAAGRVRRLVAGEGRGGAEGRPLQGRDRAGHDQDAARRDGRRYRRAPEARHHGRGAGEAAPGLRQERHGHRRQRLRHQRRRRGGGADDAPRRPSGAG